MQHQVEASPAAVCLGSTRELNSNRTLACSRRQAVFSVTKILIGFCWETLDSHRRLMILLKRRRYLNEKELSRPQTSLNKVCRNQTTSRPFCGMERVRSSQRVRLVRLEYTNDLEAHRYVQISLTDLGRRGSTACSGWTRSCFVLHPTSSS